MFDVGSPLQSSPVYHFKHLVRFLGTFSSTLAKLNVHQLLDWDQQFQFHGSTGILCCECLLIYYQDIFKYDDIELMVVRFLGTFSSTLEKLNVHQLLDWDQQFQFHGSTGILCCECLLIYYQDIFKYDDIELIVSAFSWI